MITAWRLVRPEHDSKEAAFSGEGARRFGGRWNSPGIAVVYTSANLSLAALETLAHADRRRFERDYVTLRLRIPEDEVHLLDEAALPTDWQERPVSQAARRIGDAWVKAQASVALSVPSVIVPVERNLLLNPAHPHFAKVVIDAPLPFRFDARLT